MKSRPPRLRRISCIHIKARKDRKSAFGYAENWNDFGTNLIANGAANTLGLKINKIPYTRAFGNIGRKAFTQGINQGTNYLADKAKNIFYSNDE